MTAGWEWGKTYGAIQHVFVAFATDVQLDIGGIAGGNVGLGHQERGPDLTLEQGFQPLLLLCVIAVLGEHFHVTSIRGGIVSCLCENALVMIRLDGFFALSGDAPSTKPVGVSYLRGNLALAEQLGHQTILEI